MFLSQPIIVLSLLTALADSVNAQKQLIWHEGEATLITGITLRGELSDQPQVDALLFRQAGQVRTYLADELIRFSYQDATDNRRHVVATYDVPQPTGENRAVLLEELIHIPGMSVRLLQLPAPHTLQWAKKNGLPRTIHQDWKTPQPWYVWLTGRFVPLDEFVLTDLDVLIAGAPEAVRKWAADRTRPTHPLALAAWLTLFTQQMLKAQAPAQPAPKSNFTVWYPVH